MKKSIASCLGAMALVMGACGGGGEPGTQPESDPLRSYADIEIDAGPFDSEDAYTEAMADYCGERQQIDLLAPMLGLWGPGIVAENELYNEGVAAQVEAFSAVEPPSGLAEAHRGFTDALAEQQEQLDIVIANGGEGAKVNGAFATLGQVFDDQAKFAEQLGLPDCGTTAAAVAGETETGPGIDDGTYLIPTKTVEEETEDTLELMRSGDCKAFAESFHSQAGVGEVPQSDCEANKAFAEQTEIVGTVDLGPVGYAELRGVDGGFENEWEYLVDDDGSYHLTSIKTSAGGVLRPPLPDNDAEATIMDAVAAIRADDPEAFNATLTIDRPTDDPDYGFQVGEASFDSFGSDEENSGALVADLRADPDAEPQLLGINQGFAPFLIEANGNGYLMTAQHEPGSMTDYSFYTYWALPDA